MQTKILYWSRGQRDFFVHKEHDYSHFQSSVGSVWASASAIALVSWQALITVSLDVPGKCFT